MLLRDQSDKAVELSIVGYQFEKASDEWDKNWLVIAGHVRLADHEWQFRDPCLTTWEAEALAEWLRAASATQPDDTSLSFTEPNLRFEMGGFSSDLVTVRVSFELEARPPKLRDVPWDACFADLTMLRSDLARAGADLLFELLDYPRR